MTTRTEEVRSLVFHAILRGDYGPGDLIPTEREMASTTGTSRVTVRRAYAELESSGILQRRQGSGTRIASSAPASGRRGSTIAVLASLRDPFALEFIEALERALAAQEAFLLVKLTDQDPERERAAAIALAEHGVRDLIVWASGGGYDRALFRRLRILGTNLVFFDRMEPDGFADYVGLDNRHAMSAILGHATDRGAARALLVTHSGLNADSDRQREEAFGAACERLGLPHRSVSVVWGKDIGEQVAANAAAWFAAGPALAAVGVNDEIAAHLKRAAPGQSVYGIDGLPHALASGVISYRQPIAKMAERAVELLLTQQRLGSSWRPTQVRMRGKLVGPHAA